MRITYVGKQRLSLASFITEKGVWNTADDGRGVQGGKGRDQTPNMGWSLSAGRAV